MTESVTYFIVDVFAKEKYSGNQLAVFLDLDNMLSTSKMQAITREINFAESTFITSMEDDGSFGVRIFTTEYEVPFAGHPTLGTAYIIAKHLSAAPVTELVLNLKKGAIPVQVDHPQALDGSRFTMRQLQPEFGPTYDTEKVSEALDIPLHYVDSSMPIQEVDTGLPYLIIFVKDLESIGSIKLNPDRLARFLRQEKLLSGNNPRGLTTSLFFVTRETVEKQNTYHSRMFVLEKNAIWEDAATGSANGCFLAYLLKHTEKAQSVIVEQGYEMGRKALLYLDGTIENEEFIINVGGQVVPISEGTWFV